GRRPRKAGTPFAIASTPVSAVDPDANARKMMNKPNACAPGGIRFGAGAATGQVANLQRATPTTTITRIESTNAYVGMANNAPDSFVPRRFAIAMTKMKTRERTSLLRCAFGRREVTANAPAAILTATVRM